MDPIEAHREEAPEYDQQAREWGWNPEVFFALMYQYIQPGESLLDVGIGTGLCSESFHKAGLKIYGFDAAPEMLDVCALKQIAVELKIHDMTRLPWPFPDQIFDHALCGGVFHFFGDLDPYFAEIAHLLKPSGFYSFATSIERPEINPDSYAKTLDEASGVKIYKHGDRYICNLLSAHGFKLLKELILIGSINPQTQVEHWCKIYVSRKV